MPDNDERRLAGIDFMLVRAAELTPNRIAIDDQAAGKQFTYEALAQRVNRLANGLSQIGVVKGDRVAYAFHNGHRGIEALFACSLLGAIAIPLNTRLTPAEAGSFMTAQGCSCFLADNDLAVMAAEITINRRVIYQLDPATSNQQPGDHDYEALIEQSPARAPLPNARWEDSFALGMTGGTTGGSKAVVWTHGGFMMDILGVIAQLAIRRGENTISFAPTYHIAGLGWAVLPILWQSGTVIFPPTPMFSPEFLLERVRQGGIGYLFMVPAMIEPLYAAWDGEPVTEIRRIGMASAPTFEAQRRKMVEIFPEAELMTGYGMTETFSITLQEPDDFLGHPTGCGYPAMVARVKIIDEAGNPLPQGETGEVVARTLALGSYYNNPTATEQAFRPLADDPDGVSWMHTGDVGRLDAEGRLEILDRIKDVVISGGENVTSAEVEGVVARHADVVECGVFGQTDPTWGEVVCVAIVRRPGPLSDSNLAAEIVALCRESLAGFKIPRRLMMVDALPRSAFGKVLKRDLRNSEFTQIMEITELPN